MKIWDCVKLISSHSTTSVSIPGLSLLRNDRFRKRGGEVPLYVAKNLRSKCIFKSPASLSFEIILAEIGAGPLRLLAGVVSQALLLVGLSLRFWIGYLGYDYTILKGDFNINQQTDSPENRGLLDIFYIFLILFL
jgi:hypothetical protein